MSDDDQQQQPNPSPEDGDTPQVFDADYVRKLRQENAKYRTEARAGADAATELARIREAQKSEAERLTERAEAAERAARDLEMQLLRTQVAADKGLTPTQAKRLVGDSREDLEADADALLAEFRPAETEQAVPAPRRPLENLRAAAAPAAAATDGSPRGLILAGLQTTTERT